MADETEGVDVERLREDIEEPARADFRDDLRDVRYRELGRFPALMLETAEQRASEAETRKLLIVGWRPYEVLRKAVERAAPGVEPVRDASHPVDMVEAWGTGTAPEVATMCDIALETVRSLLDEAVDAGRLVGRETTTDELLYATSERAAGSVSADCTPIAS